MTNTVLFVNACQSSHDHQKTEPYEANLHQMKSKSDDEQDPTNALYPEPINFSWGPLCILLGDIGGKNIPYHRVQLFTVTKLTR